ncbi:MAG: polyprenyl synthetase family protein [Acidobacteria bacterium]|nr:MAG: polyprenyl synthetase family protein [Acidobacteriota bacterium]PYS62630.1 MAG: polyprenyl synthetase family protein [Acidobacteriota bacterium]
MQTAGQTAYAEEVELTAKRIFDLISPELRLVEEEFERQARSNIQVIAYIGDYLRRSGGKRVRPALTILSNYAVGGDGSNYSSIRMATVMEFLHTATLVHDDVIDKAETRRNRPSINSEFGNQTAVLMGDWLYMSAFETSLAERSLPILDILTAVTRKMTEGELLQLTLLGRTDVSEEQYFDVIARKTAYLFSACCEIGALLGGADLKTQTLLRDYGMNLGVAFQLVDDLLDFTGSEDVLGKPAGADLIEGKVSLPLIFLLQREPEMRLAIQTIISDADYELVSRGQLLEALERTGALGLAFERAAEYASAALAALDGLNHSPYAQILSSLPTYIVERDR